MGRIKWGGIGSEHLGPNWLCGAFLLRIEKECLFGGVIKMGGVNEEVK